MKIDKKIFGLMVVLFTFLSCEKEIDIELNEADQRIVIEGVLNDRVDESFFKLSKTGTVYDDAGFEQVSGAVVIVTNSAGVPYVFTEDVNTPGFYVAPGFQIENDNYYSVSIDIGDSNYVSSCETFYKPQLDSLSYEIQFGGFGGGPDTSFLVFYSFTDNPDQENFYRVKAWVNGEKDNLFYLFNDELFNGQQYVSPLFGNIIESGDTVFVELLSMDNANYTYNVTLANNADGGPFSAAPANPESNIEGDAIGYFGAFTTDTLSIVIP